jgi:hypothetical protein
LEKSNAERTKYKVKSNCNPRLWKKQLINSFSKASLQREVTPLHAQESFRLHSLLANCFIVLSEESVGLVLVLRWSYMFYPFNYVQNIFYIILSVSPLYAAVVHGGASGYLLWCDLIWHRNLDEMKPTVWCLICLYHLPHSFNITVVIFKRNCFYPLQRIRSFSLIGGMITVELIFTNVFWVYCCFSNTFFFFFLKYCR